MRRNRPTQTRGFALVVTLSLMVLLSLVAVGLLGLSTITLRASNAQEARATAMANARLGLLMAVNQLQKDLGSDRRITADASIFPTSLNPHAVGVWNAWTPDLAAKSNRPGSTTVDYAKPKTQAGFRSWLVSTTDPSQAQLLDWHNSSPPADPARLFVEASSGFDLSAQKIPVSNDQKGGTTAWAVTQENTKARINVGTDDQKRISLEDRMQTPSRPNLALSTALKQPEGNWTRRPATVCRLPQAALDPGYGTTREAVARAARDFTTDSLSLLTNTAKGGLKIDLTTGFDMTDGEFATDKWSGIANPFRSTTPREYRGQRPLYQPLTGNAQVQVYMDFNPASINHKFNVNGVPTFDTLRSYYRVYRHLFNSNQGGTTAFERPYSHIAIPDAVSGRPFGKKTHPSLMPVLDRMNLFFSVLCKSDGTLCILLSPLVTIWNPHNVDIETEGLVIYPWIDFAVFWGYNITTTSSGTKNWNTSLSRMVGEGFQGHGRSSRPYFYLHLTQSGNAAGGARNVTPAIHLEPGEVRTFCMAEPRKDLEIFGNAQTRTWRMKPVGSATELTNSLKQGIILNMDKCLDGPAFGGYNLQPGDIVNANTVGFDRSTYYYIVGMADAYQIRNPGAELMVEARSAYNALPALPAERNLHFYGQIHSHRATGRGRDTISYPSFRFEEINETPRMVGSLLTYHRVAQSSSLPLADLMFTTNPRQAYVNRYLSGGSFQTGPHYESLLQQGTTLTQLAMETTGDGKKAYYGPSHSAASGKTNPAFFEIPRSPTLSLGSFQHCDITATAFGCASQIANSWASPYLPANSIAKLLTNVPESNEAISPSGLGIYDHSYLANEVLFDGYYLSGAAPRFGSRRSATGSPAVWEADQIGEDISTEESLAKFFSDPANNPLRNPRMLPYSAGFSKEALSERLTGPAKCVRLAAHLMLEGGFNINSTSEEAWTAVLASLRGVPDRLVSPDKAAQSRFRHILSSAPVNMAENDPWCGFRTLTEAEIKLLAKNLVAEIKARGPFLSLGEFVNRRVATPRSSRDESDPALCGAIQAAINKSSLNSKFSYSKFDVSLYPNRENVPNPNTGTNTPGWLSQADVLHGLAPFITPRSDTFVIRSLGEAKNAAGQVIASVRLEAVVQRLPDYVDPSNDPTVLPPATDTIDTKAELKVANQRFGRRFEIVSIRELRPDAAGNPV